ncbi:MAG: hypothetical protein KA325_01000 [Flavobacterium sp.]|nr:hypothetical protein [Flavobacterium sp.]
MPFYAKSIEAIEHKGRSYLSNFEDFTYSPVEDSRYQFISANQATFNNGKIELKARNKQTNQVETIALIPFGKTILRQVGF